MHTFLSKIFSKIHFCKNSTSAQKSFPVAKIAPAQEEEAEFIISNFLYQAFGIEETTRHLLFGKFEPHSEIGLCLDVDSLNNGAIILIEKEEYAKASRLFHAASLIIDQYHSKIHYRHSYLALQLAKLSSQANRNKYLEEALFQHPFNLEARDLADNKPTKSPYPLTPKYQGEFILGITCPIGWQPNAEGVVLDAIGRGNYSLKPARVKQVGDLLKDYYNFLATKNPPCANNVPDFMRDDYTHKLIEISEAGLEEIVILHKLYHHQAAIIYSNLGQALLLAGQNEAACGALTKSLDLNPGLEVANYARKKALDLSL